MTTKEAARAAHADACMSLDRSLDRVSKRLGAGVGGDVDLFNTWEIRALVDALQCGLMGDCPGCGESLSASPRVFELRFCYLCGCRLPDEGSPG